MVVDAGRESRGLGHGRAGCGDTEHRPSFARITPPRLPRCRLALVSGDPVGDREPLDRLGYSVEILRADQLGTETLATIVKVSEIWRGGQPERGFSMALDDVRSIELEDTLFVLGRGPDGQVAGFLHFVPVPATGDLSLSAMRRLPETPNGFNEFLVSSLLFWARDQNVEQVSLNFAVFGGVLRDEGPGAAKRGFRGALRYTDRFFQVESLLDFNRKFGPEWVPPVPVPGPTPGAGERLPPVSCAMLPATRR